MATHYNLAGKGNDLTTLRVASATIDIDGTGGLGTIAASDVVYTGVRIPHGAIVTEVSWFVTTVCTGGGSSAGTWLLGWSGDSGINNVNEARAMTIVGLAGWHLAEDMSELTPEGDEAATDTKEEEAVLRRVGSYHADAAGEELVLTTAGQNWTAGKVTFFAKYYATGDLA